ncbi:hypothetical protein B0H13DRAFT_2309179 [Mycena leptocephala]|nr:hypothetical protein B0H13DRAFT_2309179 [Mycena leptocephala]
MLNLVFVGVGLSSMISIGAILSYVSYFKAAVRATFLHLKSPPHIALGQDPITMRLPFPSRGGSPAPTAKLKTLSSEAFPDLLSTSLLALKESADAFPPLKSAVGGRAKHSKAGARNIALGTSAILDVIADAVPHASLIPSMILSIERFTRLLDEIESSMDAIALTGRFSRVIHLNRDERALQDIRTKLDDAYRGFMAASALRVEAQ